MTEYEPEHIEADADERIAPRVQNGTLRRDDIARCAHSYSIAVTNDTELIVQRADDGTPFAALFGVRVVAHDFTSCDAAAFADRISADNDARRWLCTLNLVGYIRLGDIPEPLEFA